MGRLYLEPNSNKLDSKYGREEWEGVKTGYNLVNTEK